MTKQKIHSITAKDFRVEFYRGSGNGGQNRNKTDSCCRITHIESGAVGIGEDHRDQPKNKKDAFERCIATKKFKNWHRLKVASILFEINNKKTIEEAVDEQMMPSNLVLEGRENDKWIPLDKVEEV